MPQRLPVAANCRYPGGFNACLGEKRHRGVGEQVAQLAVEATESFDFGVTRLAQRVNGAADLIGQGVWAGVQQSRLGANPFKDFDLASRRMPGPLGTRTMEKAFRSPAP